MTEVFIFAHGIGGRLDLPLSEWQVAWAGGVALVFSFAALGYFWHKPLLKKLSIGRPAFSVFTWLNLFKTIIRYISLTLFTVVLIAGFIGQDNTVANLAPITVFVVFWIGIAFASALFGHIWSEISPWETLGKLVDQIRKEKSYKKINSDSLNESNNQIIESFPSPEESMISDQNLHDILSKIKSLKKEYREILRLRFFEDYSYKEISSQLNQPLNTIKVKILRAKKLLAEKLDNDD